MCNKPNVEHSDWTDLKLMLLEKDIVDRKDVISKSVRVKSFHFGKVHTLLRGSTQT